MAFGALPSPVVGAKVTTQQVTTRKDRFIAKLVSFLTRMTYREVEVYWHPASDRSRITVSNHFGGFSDALVLLSVLPNRPGIVARDVIWKIPVVGWFMNWIGGIPVHKADDAGEKSNNDQMFASCYDALDDGGHILIFPEGVTRNEPSIARVKTGAARIALGARASGADSVTIVPVGIHYEDKAALRSRVFVNGGEPIVLDEVAPRAGNPHGADDREVVDAVTAAINTGLRRAAPDYADWSEAHLLTSGAEIALREALEDPHDAVPLGLRDRLANALADRPFESRREICDAVAAYRSDLDDLGVTDAALASRLGTGRFLANLLAQVVIGILIAPFAMVGALINVIPFLIVKAIGLLRVAPSVLSSIKPIAAFVVYGITWGVTIWQMTSAFGWQAGIATFVLLPLYLAAVVVFVERVISLWRLFARRRQQRAAAPLADQLHAERSRAIEAVLTA